jgi:hypothetical protein
VQIIDDLLSRPFKVARPVRLRGLGAGQHRREHRRWPIPASQLFAGWSAYVFAGASAGLVAALILTDPTLLRAFHAAGAGAAYGLFTGWIIGAAILGTFRGAR